MASQKLEQTINLLLRLLISMAMPLWGAGMLILGVVWLSVWWIGCGLAVIGVGIVFSAGSPLLEPFLRRLG